MRYLICVALHLLFSFSRAQSKNGQAAIDSLTKALETAKDDTNKVNLLNELCTALTNNNPKQALQYGTDANALAKKLRWNKGIAASHRLIGSVYMNALSDLQTARLHFDTALFVFNRIDNKSGIAFTERNIGTYFYYSGKPDSALKHWQTSFDLFQRRGDNLQAAKVLFNMGNVWMDRGEFNKGLSNYKLALKENIAAGDKRGEALCYSNIGEAYINVGVIDSAIEFLFKAVAVNEEINDQPNLALSLYKVGYFFTVNNEPAKAIPYLERGLNVAQQVGHKPAQISNMMTLGTAYLDLKQHEKALQHFTKAQAIALEIGEGIGIGSGYRNIGDVYFELNQLPLALEHYLKALNASREIQNPNVIVNHLELVGRVYSLIAEDENRNALPDSLRDANKMRANAKLYLNEALELAEETNANVVAKNAHSSLARLYEREKNFELSLYHFKRFQTLQDSIFSQESKVKIANLEARREADLKQKEIELQRVELQAAQRERWLIVGGAALLLALVGFAFNRFRLQQRSKRALEMEKVRSRISRDLHDDIGSTLSSINMLTHSAKKRLVENELDKTSQSLDKIQERTRRMLDNMSDIVWNIKPQNDALEEILSRMREYASTTLDAKRIDYTIDFPTSERSPSDKALNVQLPLELKNNMYLVFKEAVNNLAKHSNCTKADIKLFIHQGVLQLHIKDNGVGYSSTEINNGNGLRNMRQRSEDIGARFNVESVQGFGTTVSFSVGIPKTSDTRAAANV